MRVLILAACVAAGCFSPAERDGVVSCGAGDSCPPGFGCWDSLCWRTPPADAAPAMLDAMLTPPDATPIVVDAAPDARPRPQCSNEVDDDCDGLIDGDDPSCGDWDDDTERGSRKCENQIDDDSDSLVDYIAPSCGGGGDTLCDGPTDDQEDE